MRTHVLFVVLFSLLLSWTVSAQSGKDLLPQEDKELLTNLYHIMHLPKGKHKIYNGKGDTTFDVLYTIKVSDNKWVVYEGGMESSFDILYSMVFSNNRYEIYKGDPDFRMNIIYTLRLTRKGFDVYKGDSTISGMIYSYERE